MSDIVQVHGRLAPATQATIDKVNELMKVVKKRPQIPFVTEHMLHAGMYTRTARLPPDAVFTAVLIVPASVLIISGTVDIWTNDEVRRIYGYSVIPGAAGRKIAFITHSEVAMSVLFPCKARSVAEAEKEFTSELELLIPLSLEERHRIVITGE